MANILNNKAGSVESDTQNATSDSDGHQSIRPGELDLDGINGLFSKSSVKNNSKLGIQSFENIYDSSMINHLTKHFTFGYMNERAKINSINMKLFVLMGLNIYCEFMAHWNIQDCILYGGIIDWFIHSEKSGLLQLAIDTSDIDILTTNIVQFGCKFKYFIENWIGIEGCVTVLNRKLSPGLTISVFGVKLFDITKCSAHVIDSSEPIAIWNGSMIYMPSFCVLLSQRLLYFQTCNDTSNQLQFHSSDMFLKKGIKGFRLYVKDDYPFDEKYLPPLITNGTAQKVPALKLMKALSKRYDCFDNTDRIILVGDEAVLLMAALALEYKICTEMEYEALRKSIGQGIIGTDMYMNHKDNHSPWVYATKFNNKLNITEQPFSFCGPITLAKITTPKATFNFTIVAGLCSEFMSIRVNDVVYIPNIFTLYTLITAKLNLQPQQSTDSCLYFLSVMLSRLKTMDIETPLTGRDEFIQGFYGPNLHYKVDDTTQNDEPHNDH